MILLVIKACFSAALLNQSYIDPSPAIGIKLARNKNGLNFFFSGKDSIFSYQKYLKYFQISEGKPQEINKAVLSGSAPSPRVGYGMYYFENDYDGEYLVFLIGGINDTCIFNDFWVYDLEHDYWLELIPDPSFTPRYNFALTGYQNPDKTSRNLYLFVFGGMNQTGSINETIIFRYTGVVTSKKAIVKNFEFPYLSGSQMQIRQIDKKSSRLFIFSGCNQTKTNETEFHENIIICTCSINLKSEINITDCSLNNLVNKLPKSAYGASNNLNGNLYYYFGQYNQKPINKVFKLNLSNITNGWLELNQINSPIDCSRSYFGATRVFTENSLSKVNFFGGITNEGYSNSFGSLVIMNDSVKISCSPSSANTIKRSKGVLMQISESLIFFGGRNEDKVFNDIWSLKFPEFKNWSLVEASGIYPEPRFSHSACSQGNFMIIVGGYDKSFQILSEFWLLEKIVSPENDSFYKWKELVPSSGSEKPPPIANTCAMLDYPYLYFIGGETNGGRINDLWRFDITTSQFTRIEIQENFPSISRHGCFLQKNEKKINIFVFFGTISENGEPSNFIYVLEITDFQTGIIIANKTIENFTPRYDFSYTVIGNTLFIAGGQAYFSYSFDDFWSIDLISFKAETVELNLNYSFHSSIFGSIANKFYIYSGLEGNGEYINSESSNKIILYTKDNITEADCGKGYYFENGLCFPCPQGTYKETSHLNCLSCEKGTYSNSIAATSKIECIPCSYGTFNDQEGQAECKQCSNSSFCFIGSSYPLDTLNKISNTQPGLISPQSYLKFLIILALVTSGICLLFIALWTFVLKLRVFITVNDIFSEDHIEIPDDNIPKDHTEQPQDILSTDHLESPQEVFNENQSKYSYFGGFCTGLTFIFFFAVLTYYIYIFSSQNIEKTQVLIPSNTISNKSGFKNQIIYIYVGFNSLRHDSNNCSMIAPEKKHSRNIEVEIDDDYINENNHCTYKYKVKFLKIFKSSDSILFSFDDKCKECYTSDIFVAAESRAAYNDKKSQYSTSIELNNGMVFKGKNPSVFYIDLIPDFLKDFTKNPYKRKYGYRIIEKFNPDKGSLSSNVYLDAGLNILVQLSLNQNGIFTTEVQIMDPIEFYGLMTGACSGILLIMVILITIFEHIYGFIKFRKSFKVLEVKSEYERRIKTKERKKYPNLSGSLA